MRWNINCDFMSLAADKSILAFQNFVGLSVSDGYIATGSETNEVSFTTCLLISS